jgi:hypothetical protein
VTAFFRVSLVSKFDIGAGNLFSFEDGWHIRHFESYLDQAARGLGLEYELFMAKPGDVLFWHSALVHGGAPRLKPQATRRSLASRSLLAAADLSGGPAVRGAAAQRRQA